MEKNIIPLVATYGFEIEGAFGDLLAEKLKQIKPTLFIDCKADSSVSIHSDLSQKIFEWEELNIGIFSDRLKLLDCLSLFNSDVYEYNKTCGLHLHIKPLADSDKQRLLSFNFVMSLNRYAKKVMCDCVAKRLRSNRFCRPYHRLGSTRYAFKNAEKYQIMRNHTELGTLEFRFFAPCEHKIDNVKKLLDYIDLFLVKDNPKKLSMSIEQGNIKLNLKPFLSESRNWFASERLKEKINLTFTLNEKVKLKRYR